MTTREEREQLLQGLDATTNAITGYLVARGWSIDRILKNVASKKYSPHTAVVRIELDSENQQYWVNGEYTSEGQNVLAMCIACIKSTSLGDDIEAQMGNFLQLAETCISQSFAVRFLGDQRDAGKQESGLPGAGPADEEELLGHIQNQDELVAAGFPRERLVDLSRALGAFWESYRNAFPEVTTGDSQMVDEPGNALAVWIAQSLGIELDPRGLSLPEIISSVAGCPRERISLAMKACMNAVVEVIGPSMPAFTPAGAAVEQYLTAILCEVLYWNYPAQVDEDDDDDGVGDVSVPKATN